MFIDARTVPDGHNVECDICVIGAGAAGISLAREFIGKSVTVCLLESGGLEADPDTQSLYDGENAGLPYFPLAAIRLRFFGGTTNHWAGWCRPFSDWDFQQHAWIPNSGWPISRSELDPYYDRAVDMLGLPAEYWNLKFVEEKLGESRLPLRDFVTNTHLLKPVRLGQTFRADIEKSPHVTTYLHANVISLQTDEFAQVITAVRIATLSGNHFAVSAKHFVLATGGIENPRLLLLSNSVQKGGLGNQRGLVGRYFMDHPELMSGEIIPSRKDLPLQIYGGTQHPVMVDKTRLDAALVLSEATQRKREIVASSLRLVARPDRSHQESIWDKFSRHVNRVVDDLSNLTTPKDQRISYVRRPIDHINVHLGLDPVPNPESRVTLSDEVDRLGLRRVRVNWQLSELEWRSARETLEILGADAARANIGRLKSLLHSTDNGWPETLKGVGHHIGTTRMAEDSTRGVVDTNCKVFGISNLYVSGSSVFPTAGLGTPTLMIIALAIRLADHIKATL
jgi:choline dehydrogenase-like flavoprotein